MNMETFKGVKLYKTVKVLDAEEKEAIGLVGVLNTSFETMLLSALQNKDICCILGTSIPDGGDKNMIGSNVFITNPTFEVMPDFFGMEKVRGMITETEHNSGIDRSNLLNKPATLYFPPIPTKPSVNMETCLEQGFRPVWVVLDESKDWDPQITPAKYTVIPLSD